MVGRATQERIQDFGQGGPAEFWPQGGWAQNLLKIGGFPLKIAWKLYDFEQILMGKGGARPQGPPWIR